MRVEVGQSSTATCDEAVFEAYSESVIRVASQLLPSVVSIRVATSARGDGRRGGGGGSAIALTRDGFLLTSAHVVEAAASLTIELATGEEVRAEVIGSDRHSDL